MNKRITIFLLALATCVFPLHSKSQITGSGNQPLSVSANVEANVSHSTQKKGTFFITPFYEFTRFKNLELVSHTNNYKLWQGETSYDFTDEEIKEYNDTYNTEYYNSMTAIKIGYHAMDGLGISGYVGVNHFDFTSWISDESSQSHGSDNPALTLGLAVDYQKAIADKLTAVALVSYNYCKTATVNVDNASGQDITSSAFKSMYWDMNLALAYHYKKLMPYAGAGVTQQYVNSVHEEKTETTNNLDETVYNLTEFDANYRGSAVYGFAGLGYNVSKDLSMYARCSFANPLRVNVGFRIVL
jgi:hypothetical protein